MSRKGSRVDVSEYIDTEFSSGDSNRNKSKQYKEENNNEVNELSKELSKMGCIVDAVKRPPNICVETCVYESDDDEKTKSYNNEEDAYSDEFEEDKTDGEDIDESIKTESKSEKTSSDTTAKSRPSQSTVKHSKSHTSISSKASGSIRSDYGSISIPPTRRVNMSFTNERLREIERHNHILLTKIMSARNHRKSSIPSWDQTSRKPLPPAAVMRKKQQKQIDHDNMILLRKIQRAKSSSCSIRR